MTANTLFYILPVLILLVSFILYVFYRDDLKKVLIPAGLWVFFLGILLACALVPLYNLPQSLIRPSLYLMLASFFIAVIIFFCLSFIVPALLIIDLIKKHSDATSYLAWGTLWIYLTLIFSITASDKLRMHEFNNLGKEMQGLIQSLENYKTAHKGYPKTLAPVMPGDKYNLHRTGMLGYPYLRYLPRSKTQYEKLCYTYKLTLDCPIGILSPTFKYMSARCIMLGNAACTGEWRYILMADRFEYWVDQNYPESINRGQVIKLGRWVYIRKYN
ncbi:MAG: hypothetical protein A2297_02655 [Elusimicrobia bacterium RIFOXYB2_FULL_48_7]|nr:MAG: hypothetical protein A2297_02655 [Elusimicrobia bacterium RIFOXYB2_FULL_48_7]